jgi:hypothetical protein
MTYKAFFGNPSADVLAAPPLDLILRVPKEPASFIRTLQSNAIAPPQVAGISDLVMPPYRPT